MKSPWTPALDKELMALSAQGLSFREIAQRMGMTRNAVLGRSTRLRGIVYPSTILAWKANNERRRKGPRKPEAGRREAIAEMARNLRRGMARGEAMARASAGALWIDIGNYFGITRQGAQLAVKTWRERAGKPKKRPGRARKNKSTTSTKSIRP